jgi:cytochrome b6-f complex iron-sulfur subunit
MEINFSKPMKHSSMPRRNFIQFIIGIFGFIWGVAALYPIYRFLRPAADPLAQTNVTSVTVGGVDALPVGQGQNFQFGNIPAVVVHNAEGQFSAFNAICTHLGCTVQFRADMNRIWCACHGGIYDPATGEVLAGPPPRPLQPLQAEVVEGRIVVSQP